MVYGHSLARGVEGYDVDLRAEFIGVGVGFRQ